MNIEQAACRLHGDPAAGSYRPAEWRNATHLLLLMLMEGERPGLQESTGIALQTSLETTSTAVTQELLSTVVKSGSTSPSHSSCSPSSSPPLSGSAVSALQSKFREISQKRCKEKDKPDQLLEATFGQSVQELEDDQSSPSQMLSTDWKKKSSSSDEEGPEPCLKDISDIQNKKSTASGLASLPRGLGEGSSLENISTGPGVDTSVLTKPTSSPRHWAPPKGFWRVARPETLLLNGETPPLPVSPSPKKVPSSSEEDFHRKRKLKLERVAARKELQRSDSLESTFRRCFQKEATPEDPLCNLQRADSWESLCSRGSSRMERAVVDEKYTDKCKAKTKEVTGMQAEGQYQPPELTYRGLPPTYQDTDWDKAIITYGPELTVRSALIPAELTLSPRHEQAKRLLERARSKARSQNPETDHSPRAVEREDLEQQQQLYGFITERVTLKLHHARELIPIHDSPPPHRTITLATQDQLVPPPVQLLEVRGRNSERGIPSRRHGQSPTRVRFEDESEKEAERRYLDRVRERGPVVAERSQPNQQPKAEPILTISQVSKGSGSSWGSVGIPVAILTDEGEGTSLETVVLKEDLRKCEACGSILAPVHAKESSSMSSAAEAQGKSSPRWVTPGHSSRQIIRPALLGEVMLTGGCNLPESVEVTAVGGAGERVSAFGKLRRRSRKGESRVETSYGPYARGQELLAQRRNSRTRSSMEEVTGFHSKQTETPTRGVTFAIDSLPGGDPSQTQTSRNVRDFPGPQLPIKSALKSTCKTKPTGQRVVKLLPSVQYRLIHLDKQIEGGSHHQDLAPEEHLSVSLGTSSQASQASPGLTPCIRPSSLRYSSPVLTPELQALAIWDPVDPTEAHLSSDDVCRDSPCASAHPPECRPVVRGMGMSKAEDLRSELLRAEHRKAELQWDENLAGSRRGAEREGKPKLSLRRFFSAMGLNSMGKLVKGNRSSSMEQLSSPAPKHNSASPSPTHIGQHPLQRTPSLQSLHTESPLAQLRKASSVQSLQSPKRKFERSTILGELPLPLSLGPRELQVEGGMEPIDGSRGVGPLGRLVQAFPDGTLLLELTRPVNGPFGFVISRGKGRPDSGIYVEQVGGSPTDNVYTGLLGVGDEILEVNGEPVSGLNLDQVTRLMTRESTATIRILPHRWVQH
ncbi:uncharacterized protein KIAA1614 [Hoplias malabaricus]|uniref:uncharacterized protein KIAA1614 n=1 Tax=Hoplias malabaricus TaxID=27720 RepID=UPI0034638007